MSRAERALVNQAVNRFIEGFNVINSHFLGVLEGKEVVVGVGGEGVGGEGKGQYMKGGGEGSGWEGVRGRYGGET